MQPRFSPGEALLFAPTYDVSLPICILDEHGDFRRISHLSLDHKKAFFLQVAGDQPLFGYVCQYDPINLIVHAGAEWSEDYQFAFYGVLFSKNEPVYVRIEDTDQALWKLVDPERELFVNSEGKEMTFENILKIRKNPGC